MYLLEPMSQGQLSVRLSDAKSAPASDERWPQFAPVLGPFLFGHPAGPGPLSMPPPRFMPVDRLVFGTCRGGFLLSCEQQCQKQSSKSLTPMFG